MTKELTTTQRLNSLMENDKVKEMFANALGDNANVFVASMIELVANDTLLQQCEPRLIMQECLKAAVLNLPINKDLGFSWVIPYKNKGKGLYRRSEQGGSKRLLFLLLLNGFHLQLCLRRK